MLILGPDCILLRVEWQSNCATDEVACSAYVRQMVLVHAMNRWSLYVNLAGINVNMNEWCGATGGNRMGWCHCRYEWNFRPCSGIFSVSLSLSLFLFSLSLFLLSLSLSRSLSLSLSRSLSFFSLSQTVVVHNKSNNNNDIRQNIGLLRKNCSQNWFKGKCAGNQLTLK